MSKTTTDMTMITTKWIPGEDPREVKREIVPVTKAGRWLKVQHMTFNPKTLQETAASHGGIIRGHRHRLEPIATKDSPTALLT